MAGGAGGVSGPLAAWRWLLEVDGPLTTGQRLFSGCVGSKGSQLLMVAANVMLLLAAAQGSSIKESATGTLMCCGFYSCNAAHAVYLVRRARARAILTAIMDVATSVEADACEEEQRVLWRARRTIRWVTTMQLGYMVSMVGSVWVTVMVSGRAYAPMWPPPPLPEPWAERVVGWFEMVAMLVGCLAYFTLITLFGCMVIALTGLFRALSLRLQAASGRRDVARVVRLHQRLKLQARAVELFFRDVIAHLMVAILVVPLVATLQVVFNVADALTVLSSSILVSVFLPMTILSQNLTDSSRALAWSAFRSAFNEAGPVDVPTRRALLMVMMAASRPSRISLKGLGYISLTWARRALRVWYQWGNMLVSVSSKYH